MTRSPHDVAGDLVTALEAAHTREDVGGYIELFDPASTWVTSRGVLIAGRAELEEYLNRVMPGGLAGGSVTYRVAHVQAAGDELLILVVDQEYLRADGTLKQADGRHRHTYTAVASNS